MPHLLEDWPALIAASRANTVPALPAGRDLTGTERAALVDYTRRIGPLKTADTQRLGAAIDELVEGNTHNVNGSRRLLLVDGPSAMGKSQAVVAHALKRAGQVWAQTGRSVDGVAVVPYLYCEVGASGWARALMQSMLDFAGIPCGPREPASELLSRFRRLAPLLRVQVVIIDDAHMLRAASAASRGLTDFLKTLVTGLPASLVFVGAGLTDSALLRQTTSGYSAAEQISRRATMIELAPWSHGGPGDGWSRLVANLEKQLRLPEGPDRGVLTTTGTVRLLHQRSAGHPGLMIDWVKRAAVTAITAGQPLTQALLAATAPPLPRRPT